MPSKKHILLIFLIISFCFSETTFATNTTQDTIQSVDEEAFKASLKELPPKEFARLFTLEYAEDPIKSLLSLEHINNNMLSSQDKYAQCWGYYCLAKWENYKVNLKEAIVYINKAIAVAKAIDDPDLLLTTYIFQGNFYYDYGKYKESMESYLNAATYAKQIKHVGRQLAISKNIALLKIEVGDNSGAIELLEGTLKIIEDEHKDKFKVLTVSIHIALAKSCMRAGEFKKAEYYGNRGIELSSRNGDEDAKTYLYNFLGETKMNQGNYAEAQIFLNRAREKAYEVESSQGQLPFINLNLAKIHYYKGDFEKTIETLEKIEANQQKKNTNFFSLEDMYEFLGKSYKAIGNTEKSLYYFEKTNEVYTENDKKQNAIGIEIIKKYDLKSLKEELNQAEKRTQKTQVLLYVSIFLAVLIISGLIYFYKKREKDNQQKFEALLKSIEDEKEEKTVPEVNIVSEIITQKPEETALKEVEIIDETKEKLLKKLQNFETKQLFLSKHCSLNEVAKKLKTNTSYLSKLVNTHKGKSFTAYITDLRVNYAIRRLKEDKKFRSYTIDSIAQEIGFNRSESFSRAFKNKTGLYPSYFIKKLENQNIG
ncbi:helix-turn-helix domain-containing protein [Kordia jejudonensis]|uniref:helix-turn-helix domain-containing protein n=1 Tax=Kordia jejudonensis TaxID=1348245 RepID=UPI00069B59A6|nr:helix-turn-helix domain-containing protein [Kordia jejudonensis]